MANSLVTDAGIAAAIAAGTSGILVNITGFTLGTSSAAQGATATASDTAVDNLVFTGDTSYMTVSIQNSDTVLFRIFLGQEVGDFNIGQIGLMMGSTLFSKHVLPAQTYKTVGSPPTTLGNIKVFDVAIRLTNIANLLNLSYIAAMYASLPEVDFETSLPSAATSIYSAYLVHEHTKSNSPAVAVRYNSEWSYRSFTAYPGQGVGVFKLPSDTALLHASATINKVLYYSLSDNKFHAYDGSYSNSPIGILTETRNITTTGVVDRTAVGLATSLTAGTLYYSDSGGSLSTTLRGPAIAVALSANLVYINCGFDPKLGGITDTPYLFGVSTGSSSAYSVTISAYGAGFTAPVVGKVFWVQFHAANVANATLNLNGYGVYNLLQMDGRQVVLNNIPLNAILPVVFDGTSYRLPASISPEQLISLTSFPSRGVAFTSSGTFTVPNGVSSVEVICIGGGGGGSASGNGSGVSVPGNSGGGGGGGGYAWKVVSGLTAGSTIAVTVGAGGAAGVVASNGGYGAAGGTSSFGGYLSATGGGGASFGANTTAAGGTGGVGVGGSVNIQGTDGGCNGPNVPLGNNATMSDTHRIYNRGGIAAGGLSTMALGVSTGASGRGYGTGGGGATGGSGVSGGAGAQGIVWIRW